MIIALWITIGVLYFLLGMSTLNKNELRKEIQKLKLSLEDAIKKNSKRIEEFENKIHWHDDEEFPSGMNGERCWLNVNTIQRLYKWEPGTLFINEKTGKIEVYTETAPKKKFVEMESKKNG